MSDAEVRQLTEETNEFLEKFGTLKSSVRAPAEAGEFGKVFGMIRVFSAEEWGAQFPLTEPSAQIEVAYELVSRYLVMCGQNLEDIPGEIETLKRYLTILQDVFGKLTNDYSRIAAALERAGGDWDVVLEQFDPEYKALKERLRLCKDKFQRRGIKQEMRRVRNNFVTRVSQWCERNDVPLKKAHRNPRRKAGNSNGLR